LFAIEAIDEAPQFRAVGFDQQRKPATIVDGVVFVFAAL